MSANVPEVSRMERPKCVTYMQLLVLDGHAVVSVCSGFQIVSTIQLLYPAFKIKLNRLTDHRFSHVDMLIFSDSRSIFLVLLMF